MTAPLLLSILASLDFRKALVAGILPISRLSVYTEYDNRVVFSKSSEEEFVRIYPAYQYLAHVEIGVVADYHSFPYRRDKKGIFPKRLIFLKYVAIQGMSEPC